MIKIGVAVCGSYCTFKNTLVALQKLSNEGYDLVPIFSFNVAKTDTRFFRADEFREKVFEITQKEPITTLVGAEPLGTSSPTDLMLVMPCTGNSLAKICSGITDTPVTLAVKAHLRNHRPVVISVSTNDALGANAKNIGQLLNSKHMFFVPFGQDNPEHKQNSLISDTELVLPTIKLALQGKQIQPVIICPKGV
jgi:dipicolinate synthase subunit B